MKILMLFLTLALSGCMAPMVLMRGKDGSLVQCDGASTNAAIWGYVGTKFANHACVKQFQAAGYKRVDGRN